MLGSCLLLELRKSRIAHFLFKASNGFEVTMPWKARKCLWPFQFKYKKCPLNRCQVNSFRNTSVQITFVRYIVTYIYNVQTLEENLYPLCLLAFCFGTELQVMVHNSSVCKKNTEGIAGLCQLCGILFMQYLIILWLSYTRENFKLEKRWPTISH